MKPFHSLVNRIAIAVPGIGLFVAVALLNIPILTVIFFSSIAALCGAEAIFLLDSAAGISKKAGGAILAGGAAASVSMLDPAFALVILLIPGTVMSLWWVLGDGVIDAGKRIAGSIGIMAVIALGFGLLARLRLDFESPWILFIPLILCWAADSMAYFIGSAFGKHKLAPAVSPAKSWEGFIAGMAGAVAGAVFAGTAGAGFPLFLMVVTGTAGGIAAVTGDLFESAMKRDAGIKDTGSILPGHGGVLDRFDSILAVVPVVWLILMFYGSAGSSL